MSAIDDAWDRIERWLRDHVPEAYDGLRPGASEEAIAEAERKLGVALPEPYKASLRRHDGQEFRSPWIVAGGMLCSVEDAHSEWTTWTKMQDDGEFEDFSELPSEVPGVRTDLWWRHRWIPIVAQDGDHLVLDLDPAPDGVEGQIFTFSHELGPGRVAAPSYEAWLTLLADDLERGALELHGNALWSVEGEDPLSWP